MSKSKMMSIAAAIMAALSAIFAFFTEAVALKVESFKEGGKLFDFIKDDAVADFEKTAKIFLIVGLIAVIIGIVALLATAFLDKDLTKIAMAAIAVFVLCLIIAVWFILAPEYKDLTGDIAKFGFNFMGWFALILGVGAAGCSFLASK